MSRTERRGSAGAAGEARDALYLLCFDHRPSYGAGIFNFGSSLSAAQAEEVQDGRDAVACLVLVDGGDDTQMKCSLEIAATVEGFIGFAVGRAVFWDAVSSYRAWTLSRAASTAQIALRFRVCVGIFERRRSVCFPLRSSVPA